MAKQTRFEILRAITATNPLMTGFTIVGHATEWFLRTGATDPVAMVLTIAFVVVVNLVIYLLKNALG